MIATCLTLVAVALHAGHVVALPSATALVAASPVDWLLREHTLSAPTGTRAIVTRVAPEGFAGVVEVKLYDGTDRLWWTADTGLVSVAPADPGRGPKPPAASLRAASRDVKKGAVADRRRRGGRPSFGRIDAALAGMTQAASADHDSGSSCSSDSMPGACESPIGVACGGS